MLSTLRGYCGFIAPYRWCQRVDTVAALCAQRVKHKGNNVLTLRHHAVCHLSHNDTHVNHFDQALDNKLPAQAPTRPHQAVYRGGNP